ncbi:hypothetical protein SAMN02800692_2373 [Luteibacter sp. UNC138MFCol5.1]|uniref:hypothetical protein n=1 Tax=Luteibacter sp. UNC138MFCol5.1 TaxID=1502774 RepID=UPI0008C9EFB0|nr:hypothetical protein [Luteibacter sp. UNC138MFCol5.1]SEO82468.1 hypothetical protein SAMN02800692_2373 [Luteibacter sp. UNC138MFCol5.1]
MTKYVAPWILAAGFLLVGCDATPPAPTVPAPVTADSAASSASGASTCPATFDAFLTAFENDVAVQKNAVTDPLQSDSVDPNADPEPRPVTKMLAKGAVTFPVMPDSARQTKDGLVATRTEISPTEVSIKLTKPDTDYQTTFFFRKDDCWHLYRVKDDSL